MLTHFSLFSGIGGIDLAAEWAGFETVGQCEWADYPTKILQKHWPDVQRWRDVRDVTAESVRAAGIGTVTLLSGGFPCQPFSVAGKQRGKEDDRYLWPEMCRVIEELRPHWVIGENVAGIVRMALDQVLSDLEAKGYTAIPFVIPACGIDAPHRRERVFIVANSGCTLRQGQLLGRNDEEENRTGNADKIERSGSLSAFVADTKSNLEGGLPFGTSQEEPGFSCSSQDVANANNQGLQAQWFGRRLQQAERETCAGLERRGLLGQERHSAGWESEPDVGRVAHGVPSRVDRLKCLGNAVVPQQVYPILKAIAEIELQQRTTQIEYKKEHGYVPLPEEGEG